MTQREDTEALVGKLHVSGTTEAIVPVDRAKDLLGRNIISGLRNADQEQGINPKDKIGATKIDLTLLPTSAKIAWALAQMDGARKYGPYNWRIEPVQIMTYLGAAERHLDQFKEGEEVASDSLVHHLGHVMACCAIIIDAMSQGKAIDNRPINNLKVNLVEQGNTFVKQSQKPVTVTLGSVTSRELMEKGNNNGIL